MFLCDLNLYNQYFLYDHNENKWLHVVTEDDEVDSIDIQGVLASPNITIVNIVKHLAAKCSNISIRTQTELQKM